MYISQKISKIFQSLGFLLSLVIFANFWRVSEILISKKNLGFGFGKFGLGKKCRFWFWKIWSRKKSLVFGFGKFGLAEKVSKFQSRHSVTTAYIGFMILLSLLLGNAETDGEYWRSQKEEIKNLLLCRLEQEGRNVDGGLGIWRVGGVLIKQSKDKYFYPVLDQGQHRWWHFERSTVWGTQQRARPHGAGLSLPPAPPPNRPEV